MKIGDTVVMKYTSDREYKKGNSVVIVDCDPESQFCFLIELVKNDARFWVEAGDIEPE